VRYKLRAKEQSMAYTEQQKTKVFGERELLL
jgi:hypothetical protein